MTTGQTTGQTQKSRVSWISYVVLGLLVGYLAGAPIVVAVDGWLAQPPAQPAAGYYTDAPTDMAADGRQELKIDKQGNLWVTLSNVTVSASAARVQGTGAEGVTPTGDPLQVAGKDPSSVARILRVDTDGTVRIDPTGTTTQPVSHATLAVTGGGVEATALRVTVASDSTGLLSVDDNGGSLTIDNASIGATTDAAAADTDGSINAHVRQVAKTAAVIGGGTEAAAQRVTIASDSTGVVSVDDNGAALTVDSAQLPAALGGGAEAGALLVTVANNSTGVLSVDDNSGSLTVDTPQLPAALGQAAMAGSTSVVIASDQTSVAVTADTELPAAAALADNASNPTTPMVGAGLLAFDGATWDRLVNGGGTEAAALRVTIASDSTGVLSVDDNAGSLTVDSAQLPAALVGGRLDVVVGAALPAGTANIGDVDIATIAAGDTNIGNVDVVTVPAPLSTAGGGTEATALRVTIASDSTGVLSVDDNAGSLTVDTPQLPAALVGGRLDVVIGAEIPAGTQNIGDVDVATLPVGSIAATAALTGGGVELGALRVTIASDSTGVVSVDDNGAALTVDTAQLPAALGQAAMAGSTSVVIASDQSSVAVTEASGAAIKTAVEAIDDWDESDRAKVNPVVGQAGVAAGTGVDATNALRVSLATNVPLPAGTNAIGKLAANSGVDIGDVDVTSIAAGDNNIGNVDIASAIPAGANVIGKVSIDQTTPGTTDLVSVATAQGAGATIGTTAGAAVITSAEGTLQQYLRGLVALKKASSSDANLDLVADADAAITSGAGRRLRGVVWSESAGSPGTFAFRVTDGATGASGTVLFARTGAASESNSIWFGEAGIDISASGSSVDWVSGEVDVWLIWVAP